MRKLGLFQISQQLIASNDNASQSPGASGAAAAPPPALERPPARARAAPAPAPAPLRTGGHRGPGGPVARGQAPIVPPNRALRPRRRS